MLDIDEANRLEEAAAELFRCILNIQRVRRNDSILGVDLPVRFFGCDYTVQIRKSN